MDGVVGCSVDVYYVSIFNSRLEYFTRRVFEYDTNIPNTQVYIVCGVDGRIVIQTESDTFRVTYAGRYKGMFKMPLDTKLGEMLKVAVSQMVDRMVTIEKRTEERLF